MLSVWGEITGFCRACATPGTKSASSCSQTTWRERSRLETEEEEGDGADEEPRVPFSAEYFPCHLDPVTVLLLLLGSLFCKIVFGSSLVPKVPAAL